MLSSAAGDQQTIYSKSVTSSGYVLRRERFLLEKSIVLIIFINAGIHTLLLMSKSSE